LVEEAAADLCRPDGLGASTEKTNLERYKKIK
jgi:hypothetical protein